MVTDEFNQKMHYLNSKEELSVQFLEAKINLFNRAFCTSFEAFQEIENELDRNDSEDQNESLRRRKKTPHKAVDFQSVSSKVISDDFSKIKANTSDDTEESEQADLKKNDFVLCIVDRKKYKGTIVSVTGNGIMVRTTDRRKIKINWEDIDDRRTKVTKLEEVCE